MATKFFRTFTLDESVRSGEMGTPIQLSASSDIPYQRRNFYEVLSHDAGAVDLTRLNNRAAVLVDHEGDQVGVVERAWLDANKLRAEVRFSKSVRGQEIEQDIRDGIRSNVSIGYVVEAWDDPKTRRKLDGVEVRTATNWLPFEISMVAVPADFSVGVGRSLDNYEDVEAADRAFVVTTETSATSDSTYSTTYNDDGTTVSESLYTTTVASKTTTEEVPDEALDAADEDVSEELTETPAEEADDEAAENAGTKSGSLLISNTESTNDLHTSVRAVSVEAFASTNPMPHAGTTETRKMDKELVAKLTRLASEYGLTDKLADWLSEGRSYESVAADIFESKRNVTKAVHPGITLSRKEEKAVSFRDAFEALMEGRDSELGNIGRDVARQRGIPTKANALYIPTGMPLFKRTLATSGNGSQLVGTDYVTFEELMREESILGQLGVEITEENSVVAMPRQLSATPFAWVGEGGSISVGEGSYDVVTWTPKTLAVAVPYTRQLGMMNGHYSVEDTLRRDIALTFLEQSEGAVFAGSGSLQPSGLVYDSTIPVATSATGSLTSARLSKLWQVQAENKGRAGTFVVTPGIYALGTQTPAFSNSTYPLIANGEFMGQKVIKSNFMPVTGTAHSAIYGDFSGVKVAHFGVLEIVKDEITNIANGGIVLRGFMYMDSKTRQPKKLAKDTGIIIP